MKRLAPLLILFTAIAFGQDVDISVPYSKYTLDNGLTVILHEDHTTPIVSVNMMYHVGSGNEKPGRTGFAHLFEHIMFEGSENVPEGKFDEWLEAAGGSNNGSTDGDRTNYWENVPTNALDLALFLESDRMGFLLGAMSPEKVDGQRDVVKNERRQSYEDRPYGMVWIALRENLYPENHPYHWPTIGSMEDLSAASYEDVVEFFNLYYTPNNASLVIAGDISPEETLALTEKWFGGIKRGEKVPRIEVPELDLTEERRVTLEDKVQLPRIHFLWHTPAIFEPGDAEMNAVASILAEGKNARLYKRLVYDMQIAQSVVAFQASSMLGSYFMVRATARAGHTLDELEEVINEEIALLKSESPSEREIQRMVNQVEASFISQLERIGGFGGKADRLNHYYYQTGEPDYFNTDLNRYRSLTPESVKRAAQDYLIDARVVISVIPEKTTDTSEDN
ncbi:MAG: insulinase family protein [Candidatus Marinimicrobia bacterium]|nr:insulinase family protein [Candidatus Neomarinimicrobiota bacterium]